MDHAEAIPADGGGELAQPREEFLGLGAEARLRR
jgi:hypothetical protein